MKLHIEVTLSTSEIPHCTELLHVLRQITDNVATRNNTALFAELLARLGRQPIPHTMTQEEQLEQVAADITALLDANGGSDEVVQQLFEAFVAHVFGGQSATVGSPLGALLYVFLLSRLGDQYRTKMRDKLVPAILKFLTIKRPIDCDRREFFAYAEAFASLVKLEFVSITGAVTTITTLLLQADTRCAAITMLGKTVELCLSLLAEKCDPSQLSAMRAALRNVTDDAFRYDISYIQENMSWNDVSAKPSVVGGAGGAGASTAIAASSSSVFPPASVSRSGNIAPTMTDASSSSSSSSPASSAAAAAASSLSNVATLSATTHGLVTTRSLAGHTGTIFALGYDSQFDLLVSSGKDSQVITWSSAGVPVESIATTGHYACSIDVNSARRQVLICGVVQDAALDAAGSSSSVAAPCVLAYQLGGTATAPTLTSLGKLEKRDVKLVSCVKALLGQDRASGLFVTGESTLGLGENVCLYDSGSATSFSALEPLRRFSEHRDIITALAHTADGDGSFLSGSRDCTVRIWDKRSPKSIGQLLAAPGAAAAHSKMITCLDAGGGVVVSAGLDKVIKVWDVRRPTTPLRQVVVDDNAILKVAIGGGGSVAAVSTLRRLYLVDLLGADGVVAADGGFGEQRTGRYHDLKWNANSTQLFAAGDDHRVDVYGLFARNH